MLPYPGAGTFLHVSKINLIFDKPARLGRKSHGLESKDPIKNLTESSEGLKGTLRPDVIEYRSERDPP